MSTRDRIGGDSGALRKVTVAVSGGIAAYKALGLVRALQQAGLDPHVVMTASAERFVTPLSFAAISGHKVITSLWAEAEEDAGRDSDGGDATLDSAIEHIAEAQTTRALVVAPATAHTLARFAHGIADDFLSTMYLATKAPVVLAPAMNVKYVAASGDAGKYGTPRIPGRGDCAAGQWIPGLRHDGERPAGG